MAYPVAAPGGYTAPAAFTAKTAASNTTTQYTAINSIQDNVLAIGYDLTQLVPFTILMDTAIASANTNIATVNTNVLSVNTNVNSIITSQNLRFSNLSTQIGKISSVSGGVTTLDNIVLTQSFSFMVGAFVAIAFVLASKIRY